MSTLVPDSFSDEVFAAYDAWIAMDARISDFLYGTDKDPSWSGLIADHWVDPYDQSLEVCLVVGKTPSDVPASLVARVREWGFFLLHFSVEDPTGPSHHRPRKPLGGSLSFAVTK